MTDDVFWAPLSDLPDREDIFTALTLSRLLVIAARTLDDRTGGRAHPQGSMTAKRYRDAAIAELRRGGPHALDTAAELARGWTGTLAELVAAALLLSDGGEP